MNKYKIILGEVLVFIFLLLIAALISSSNKVEEISNLGSDEIILSQSLSDRVLMLDGEWDFYWGKLLVGDELEKVTPDTQIKVPSVWNSDGYSGSGAATYRKTLFFDDAPGMLALRIPHLSTAYEVYANGERVSSAGIVSENVDEMTPEYKRCIAVFNVDKKKLDIVVQVSNKDYARGGFWYTPFIGSHERVISKVTLRIIIEAILVGILLVMFLNLVYVYFLDRNHSYVIQLAGMYFFWCHKDINNWRIHTTKNYSRYIDVNTCSSRIYINAFGAYFLCTVCFRSVKSKRERSF